MVDSRAPPSTASSPPRDSDARQHEPLLRFRVTSNAACGVIVPARIVLDAATVGQWQICKADCIIWAS